MTGESDRLCLCVAPSCCSPVRDGGSLKLKKKTLFFLFVLSWDLYKQYLKAFCIDEGRWTCLKRWIEILTVLQSPQQHQQEIYIHRQCCYLSVFTYLSSVLVIRSILGISWFSTLSEPDCHHHLLCWPNDQMLSNSTHRRSALL